MPDAFSSDSVLLQLLPDWAPSGRPDIIRLGGLLKLACGEAIDRAEVTVQFFDATGQGIGAGIGPWVPECSLVGPGWWKLTGRIQRADPRVARARARLGEILSAIVDRDEGEEPLVLVAIPLQVGVPYEPHLWWRFRNPGPDSRQAADVFTEMTFRLDGRAFRQEATVYDGPAWLPAGQAVSGFLSLDHFDATARRGTHEVQVEVMGECSALLSIAWRGDPGPMGNAD